VRRNVILFTGFLILTACASGRLSHDDARRKIAEIGRSRLVPDAVEIRRIVSQTETQAIAETTVTLAFQFKKDTPNGEWKVESVRLGDQDWIDLNELLAAVNEGRRRQTIQGMEKLVAGIQQYQMKNGSVPNVRDIVALTDTLHPLYMSDLVRLDGWGNPIEYEVRPTGFQLISKGADGLRGSPDDIVLP
jgi:hypothetical protein